jgi:putative tryptophan/tyrosine transport system substrate-binding protein
VELEQDSVGRACKVAMITYAHNEPLPSLQMEQAEQGLAAAGYRAETGCEIRRWFGNRDRDLTLRHAHEVFAWGPDVVMSFMTNADLAMLEVTGRKGLPIVCWSMDPVGGGLVESLDHPEANLTGVTLREPIQQAQLDVLLLMRPSARRIAALHNPTYAIAPAALARLEEVAGRRGISVTAYQCLTAAEIAPVFARMAADGFDAAVIGPHEVFNGNGAAIAQAAASSGVAVVGLQTVPQNGGPAGFGIDFAQVWARGGAMAGKILDGANVADLPFERSLMPHLWLNRAALGRLGIELTPQLEAMAYCIEPGVSQGESLS